MSASGVVNGKPTMKMEMGEQMRTDTRYGVRAILCAGTIALTSLLTAAYLQVVAVNGLNPFEIAALVVFIALAFWISFPLCSCLIGFWGLCFRRKDLFTAEARSVVNELPRTAVLVPIYNESPNAVFSAVLAMARSLEQTRQSHQFEFFILSDTQKQPVWRQEELAWAKTSAAMPDGIPLFYRRRTKNVARKAGNIAEFVSRWGGRYELMVILDADSVMEGTTLIEMTARAAADPSIGILQVPPKPVDRKSFLARVQQFSADVYGPVFQRGFTIWTGNDGNYFGHNAVIRTSLFAKNCNLPVLAGEGPLGGHILSHDFVEAALMSRAGLKVVTADDLGGSYEECPTTLLDYAIRDQRWCQGNLQHGRLLMSRGWRLVNRFHFLTGILSYLSSGLWLAFMVFAVSGFAWDGMSAVSDRVTVPAAILFGTVMVMLLTPKVLALVALMRDREKVALLGGWGRVLAGAALETLFTALLAPILAIYHATFVISTVFLGKSVQWNGQARDERVIPFKELFQLYRWHTAAGLGVLLTSFAISVETGLWTLPISLGLCLSMPLAAISGSRAIGEWLGERRILSIPEEVVRPEILIERDRALDELSKRNCHRRPDLAKRLLKLPTSSLLDPATTQRFVAGKTR